MLTFTYNLKLDIMKTDIKDIINFIGESVRFDDFGGGYFWGKQPNGVEQMIAEVRGYGAIKNLFLNKKKGCDFDKVDQFQDDLGKFIAEAITEKIERERVSHCADELEPIKGNIITKSKNKKGYIEIDLTGPEGNVFVLMGYVRSLSKTLNRGIDRNGYPYIDSDKIIGDMMSSDYEHAVEVFDKHFGDYVVLYR